MWTVETDGIAATEQVGALLARSVGGERAVVLLEGALGAGKTAFARGFLRALGLTAAVTSPTYAIVHSHGVVSHADVYRVRDVAELEHSGIVDGVEQGTWLIEWASRFPEVWPDDHVSVAIAIGDGDQRRVTITASGPVSAAVLDRLGGSR